jgi:hypothetical protein
VVVAVPLAAAVASAADTAVLPCAVATVPRPTLPEVVDIAAATVVVAVALVAATNLTERTPVGPKNDYKPRYDVASTNAT